MLRPAVAADQSRVRKSLRIGEMALPQAIIVREPELLSILTGEGGPIMAESFSTEIRRASTWSIVLSVLMIVAGVLAIASPFIAGVAVAVVVGWLLIFSAALHLVYAFRGGRVTAVLWEVLLAVVYGLIGFYVLANPVIGLATLTFMIAFYLFVESILEFALSYQLRKERGAGWLVFDGIVTLILAVMIWSSWPYSGLWAIGTLVGVSMLFSGITRLGLAYTARRVADVWKQAA
jgi:uncharacterized membrane protein HdeD (DUF308 family)